MKSANPALLLAAALCLFPFLVPGHEPPLWTFHSEWTAVALGIAGAGLMLANSQSWEQPPQGINWLWALFLVILLQVLAPGSAYVQLPVMGALHVAFAGLMVWLGCQLKLQVGMEPAARTLAAFVLAGAVLNAAAGILQFHGHPALIDDLITPRQGNRVFGNIAQANLYADYLALGTVSAIHLHCRRALGVTALCLSLILLGYAAALSGSRLAILFAIWPAALAVLLRNPPGDSQAIRKTAIFAAALLLGTHLCATAFAPWTASAETGQSSLQRFAISGEINDSRLAIWETAIRIFLQHPLTGTGIGQFPGAVFEAAFPSDTIWTSPHNLLLHLLAETGVPGAALTVAFLVRCFAGGIALPAGHPAPERWWLLSVLGVLLLHSMVEFPLWYAHFLGIFALCLGLWSQPAAGTRIAVAGTTLIGLATLLLAMALASSLVDFVRLDSTRVSGATTLTAASGTASGEDARTLESLSDGLLGPMADYWFVLKSPVNRDHLARKLEATRKLMHVFPSPAIATRRSAYLAMNGEQDKAADLTRRTLDNFPKHCAISLRILDEAASYASEAIAPLQRLLDARRECRHRTD